MISPRRRPASPPRKSHELDARIDLACCRRQPLKLIEVVEFQSCLLAFQQLEVMRHLLDDLPTFRGSDIRGFVTGVVVPVHRHLLFPLTPADGDTPTQGDGHRGVTVGSRCDDGQPEAAATGWPPGGRRNSVVGGDLLDDAAVDLLMRLRAALFSAPVAMRSQEAHHRCLMLD